MVSDSGENMRLTKPGALLPVPEQAELIIPCPRCDSANTKFCYYNNYNLSQPRHFCKSCRRYWTQGGTLRDIPVGGGTRKTAKRSRPTTTSVVTDSAAADDGNSLSLLLPSPPPPANPGFPLRVQFGYGGGDEEVRSHGNLCGSGSGSFSSLLNPQGVVPGGVLAVNGFGLGFEDMGYGFGRGGWSFSSVIGEGGGAGDVGSSGGGHDSVMIGMGDTWQADNGSDHNGFVGGDCFSWPDLAISTPGNGLK